MLAAGEGKRFGGNKLAAVLQGSGRTVIQQVIEKALKGRASGCAEGPWAILVITNLVNMRTIPSTEGVEVLDNERYREGMSESVKIAIKEALRRKAEGLFFFLGDMPFISDQTIQSVSLKALQEPEMIIRPRWQTIPGFPLYFPSRFFDRGLTIAGDQGLKSILKPLSESVRWIETIDSFCIKDIDRPSDLQN
ncbi:MAG TPA: nucleotidyltransferase family protein [Thermotogota bacterium]|nr:nucleotidyltransferase family protein [Thermotogota bacterium]HNR63417.1 nucleotidyltransferase family protein [Thermotogota bacterium]